MWYLNLYDPNSAPDRAPWSTKYTARYFCLCTRHQLCVSQDTPHHTTHTNCNTSPHDACIMMRRPHQCTTKLARRANSTRASDIVWHTQHQQRAHDDASWCGYKLCVVFMCTRSRVRSRKCVTLSVAHGKWENAKKWQAYCGTGGVAFRVYEVEFCVISNATCHGNEFKPEKPFTFTIMLWSRQFRTAVDKKGVCCVRIDHGTIRTCVDTECWRKVRVLSFFFFNSLWSIGPVWTTVNVWWKRMMTSVWNQS